MCESVKKTALVIPNDDEVDEDEGDEDDESRFFSGFLTWMMVSGFGGRGRFPSNSARAERKYNACRGHPYRVRQ